MNEDAEYGCKIYINIYFKFILLTKFLTQLTTFNCISDNGVCVQEFSASYLQETRRGMWDDSREALGPLGLSSRSCILDVGCGTGELTQVLAEESKAKIAGLDADTELLQHARAFTTTLIAGDGTQLPFPDNTFDLVVCQALLINLPNPKKAITEFARVSNDTVAVIEPNNRAVMIDSTVDEEVKLANRTRTAFLSGLSVDGTVTVSSLQNLLGSGGLTDIQVSQYKHTRSVSPPYSEHDLTTAKTQATGRILTADEQTLLTGNLSRNEYDLLRDEWRRVGRKIVKQMQTGNYRRTETVPFYVAVGNVE